MWPEHLAPEWNYQDGALHMLLRRSPLVLSLSEDGKNLERHYILADDSAPYEQYAAGMHKVGDYGYLHTLVHDDALHVIVCRRKEVIEVLWMPLSKVAGASSSGTRRRKQ